MKIKHTNNPKPMHNAPKHKKRHKKEQTKSMNHLHYCVSGVKSEEAIVFLHPAFADHRAFDKQLEFFSNDYRIITFDLPGHGLSQTGKVKIDQCIHGIASILEDEGFEKAHFVGVSLGSLIAQYFALHYPEKVHSLTVLGGYDINADNRELAKAQRAENIKWIFKALFSMNSFRRYVATVSLSKPQEQARFYEMAKMFTRKSFLAMSGMRNIVKQREGVFQDYPLLILSGDKDIELAISMSKKWHKENPSSQFFMIENAGHCANMDDSEAFNKVVMGFIKKNKYRNEAF